MYEQPRLAILFANCSFERTSLRSKDKSKIIQYFDSPNKKAQALHPGQPMINMKQTITTLFQMPGVL